MGYETVELIIIASHIQYIFPFDVIFMVTAVVDMDQDSSKKELVEITLLCNTTFPSNSTHKVFRKSRESRFQRF